MANILGGIGTAITTVLSWVTSLLSSVGEVFYDATNGFTFIGTLVLVAFGLSMVWVGINFIRSLVKRG